MSTTTSPRLTETRQNLYRAYMTWNRRSESHAQAVLAAPEDPPQALYDAHGGCMMAASYAYTLAAVLKVAADEIGLEAAGNLAGVARDLLENGDHDNLNSDLDPTGEGQPT